jgi:hypothetical protein
MLTSLWRMQTPRKRDPAKLGHTLLSLQRALYLDCGTASGFPVQHRLASIGLEQIERIWGASPELIPRVINNVPAVNFRKSLECFSGDLIRNRI